MSSKDKGKPNIIVIMTDDQGAWAMRCAGNTDILTPNLDRLASSGIRFSNFFCVSPVCSPARASFLTGSLPSQHGIHDWIRSGNMDKEAIPEAYRDDPAFKEETLAVDYLANMTAYTEILAANGYTCGLSGKWHLGDSLTPQKGFSHWFTIAKGGCGYYEAEVINNGELSKESRYITEVITDNALAFLQKQEETDDAFYLSVHYTAPHTPWERKEHPKKYFDLYEECLFEATPDEPVHPQQINSCTYGTGEKRKELLKGYYASITAMDEHVGRIIDYLEHNGLRENTLLVFTGDNGMNTGHHGIWGKGNGTFPQNMFDTSVKVPFIVSRPGHVPEGLVNDQLLSHYDFMPTLLEYINIGYENNCSLPGKSFVPIWVGKSLATRERVVVYDEYGPVRMIRTQQWKYVHRFPDGPHELYRLSDDPDEERNLIVDPSVSEMIAILRIDLNEWFLKYVDPAFDGSKEPVTGRGQLGKLTPGSNMFSQDHRYVNR
jgi:choline-sulfatase